MAGAARIFTLLGKENGPEDQHSIFTTHFLN